ncbi:MAG: hypothetical protein M1831_006720 [Alyxoria varia]|nr:MAG: hypothetical protein M1831_006720 [Alyxoria varia]
MAIPINLLRKVRIPLRKKIALAGLFSIVVITTVIAIVRITMINIIMDRVLLWSSIEQSVAIIVACLGAFPSLFIIQSRAPSPEKRHPPAVVDASLNRARQRMKVLRPSDTELINSGRSSSSITDDSNLTRQDDVTNGNKATDEYA